MKTTMKLIFISVCLLFTFNANSQKFKKIWSDEFNGKGALSSQKWDYEIGYVRNNELQYYTKDLKNIRQRNGNLEITVVKEPKTLIGHKYGESASFDYTSGSPITLGKFDFTYGKIEGRFKVPVGKGLWTCFWMLGVSHHEIGWPKCGELDIFEHINSENMVHGTAHWADVNDKHTRKGSTFKDIDVTQWHVYSIVWSPEKIEWFVDDKKFHELDIKDGVNSTHEYHKPHYILINLPIGGSWPGSPDETTVLPATLYCDYVRVYQLVESKK
jgi:beta-glucanase (GH16 family)